MAITPNNRKLFERLGVDVVRTDGRAGLVARICSSCSLITSLGRDRPRRFILPITQAQPVETCRPRAGHRWWIAEN
jgi:hypothetical protein